MPVFLIKHHDNNSGGVTGTILPTIERAFHLSYSSVSLLFVSYCVGYLITAYFSWRRLRAGRVSWWVPLVGAVVTYLAVYVCLAVPLLGDPAFVRFATSVS